MKLSLLSHDYRRATGLMQRTEHIATVGIMTARIMKYKNNCGISRN